MEASSGVRRPALGTSVSPTSTRSSIRHRTCLLVDDHDLTRGGVRKLLHAIEWADVIGEASDMPAALALVEQLRPDLAVVDPQICGERLVFELTKSLQSAHPEMRIVIYTASDRVDDARQAMRNGAFGYVSKRSGGQTLVDALWAASRGEQYLDPTIAAAFVLAEASEPALSVRELDTLRLMATGMQNAEIAEEMHISRETVKAHVSHVLTKLDATTRTQAVVHALRRSIIE